jgi:hypothetical protein
MRNNQHTYELRRGFTLDDHFTGTLRDARRRGEMMATRLCDDVTLYAFNEPLSAWTPLGTFHGHMRFTTVHGHMRIIKDDFSGLAKARKEDRQ